jgi:hypothetical protein
MPDNQPMIFAHPAAVVLRATTAELLALVKSQHAFDETVFAEHPPFFFGAEISSNRLDTYGTRMAPSSLRNYAADAQAGVSFQDSHQVDRLGLGRSLTGVYEELGDGLARVLADFYTIPGLPDTDAYILRLRAGIAKDVSIGYYRGDGFIYRCSICNQDMLSWDCPHIPLFEYEVRDAYGNVTGKQIAFAWVENGRLAETSAVYDGACPGAAVLKAQQEAAGGRLRPEAAQILEARYRIKLPGANHLWEARMPDKTTVSTTGTLGVSAATADLTAGDPPALDSAGADTIIRLNARLTELGAPELDVPERQQWLVARVELAQQAEGTLADVRAILATVGAADGVSLAEAVRQALAELPGLRTLASEQAGQLDEQAEQLETLTPLAEEGRQYRADLIADAMAEGVRAYGPTFRQETYRGILEAAPLATVKAMREDWRTLGDRNFAGGRQTQDGATTIATPAPKATLSAPVTPDAAYRA